MPDKRALRSAIRDEVASIDPFDPLERAHCEDALAWIDSAAELWRIQKPAIPPKHLVSYFVLVDHDHVLLVDHENAQLWLPSGGHVEPGDIREPQWRASCARSSGSSSPLLPQRH